MGLSGSKAKSKLPEEASANVSGSGSTKGKKKKGSKSKNVKEITVTAPDVISPEGVFANASAALTDSTRSSKGEKSGGSTAASRKIDAAMENALKKSKLEEQARAPPDQIPRQPSGLSEGSLSRRGTSEASLSSPTTRPTDRAAAIERAKSIAASITAAVETEKRASIGSSPQSTIVAFRAYGEKEVREASRDVEAALDSILGQKKPVAPSKKDKPNSPKAMAYKAYEVASGLREEERLRSTQFMAVVSRASSGASEEDQLTAVRAYSSTIQKLMDERMAQIPMLPPNLAGPVSAYLSALSQHKVLAGKALAAEDPRRAQQEQAARDAARLSRAKSAAEARAAGLGIRPAVVGPSGRAAGRGD